MGPSKLAYCELYDHRDGTYTLSVRPSEVGKHTLGKSNLPTLYFFILLGDLNDFVGILLEFFHELKKILKAH